MLADQLNRLTQDYLQAMCEIIVNSGGTLDKVRSNFFIFPFNSNIIYISRLIDFA